MNSDLPMAELKLICKKENQRYVAGRGEIALRRRAKRQSRKAFRKKRRQTIANFVSDIKVKIRNL